MVKVLDLTQGKATLVDDDVFAWASRVRAHASQVKPGYFVACVMLNARPRYLHRVILAAPKGVMVDHINHDALDNRRANLRLATASQNNCNARKRRGFCSSAYKGVGWSKDEERWQASIRLNGKSRFLGYYDSEADAAAAYNVAASKIHGAFACLNVLDEDFPA